MATRKTPFTSDEVKLIQRAALAVWDECAYDLIASAMQEGRNSLTRAEVIEVALDAGRAEEKLRGWQPGNPLTITDDFLHRFEHADYQQLIRLVRPVFPHARYGM